MHTVTHVDAAVKRNMPHCADDTTLARTSRLNVGFEVGKAMPTCACPAVGAASSHTIFTVREADRRKSEYPCGTANTGTQFAARMPLPQNLFEYFTFRRGSGAGARPPRSWQCPPPRPATTAARSRCPKRRRRVSRG